MGASPKNNKMESRMSNTERTSVREIAGIRFELRDNGRQHYYTTSIRGVTYDINQNKGESCWWVLAHRPNSAVISLDKRDIPCSIEELQNNINYLLHAVALYIKKGASPYSNREKELSFRFNLEAQVLQAIRPESFEQDLAFLMKTYNAVEVRAFTFTDQSSLTWDKDNPLLGE
jgi:hypothetical protein